MSEEKGEREGEKMSSSDVKQHLAPVIGEDELMEVDKTKDVQLKEGDKAEQDKSIEVGEEEGRGEGESVSRSNDGGDFIGGEDELNEGRKSKGEQERNKGQQMENGDVNRRKRREYFTRSRGNPPPFSKRICRGDSLF